MFGDDTKDLYSTGNRGKDIGLGIIGGLSSTFNQPGKYYVRANYAGNGLANTGLGYIRNDNYINPYDAVNALTSILYEGNKKEGNDSFGQMNTRLSDLLSKPMFNNLLDRSKTNYPLHTETFNLPQVGNIGGGVIGDYNNSWYDYNLPVQQTNFKLPWE